MGKISKKLKESKELKNLRGKDKDSLLSIILSQKEELEFQSGHTQLLFEQIQLLKDEIAILKGEKPRPKIKPSTLNKDKDKKDKSDKGGSGKPGKRGKPTRKKTKDLEIHEEVIIHPENIPPGSVFKGYEDYIVQDIEIQPKNTKFRRGKYKTPTGEYIRGKLPEFVKGSHFGVKLKSYILNQHYQQHVTIPLLLNELKEFGIEISRGQLGSMIIEGHGEFHQEKDDLLQAGLEVSSYINVDDTGARHKGKNGVSTHIGNELFAWFSSTESKSRVNFLELLCAGSVGYRIDDVARDYMLGQKLAKTVFSLLKEDKIFSDKASFEEYLESFRLTDKQVRVITEGLLVAHIVEQGIFPELVIMSDDAGQFRVSSFLNALCWVHSERTINKIIGYSEGNRKILEEIQDQIWTYYQRLKKYRENPSKRQKTILAKEFDKIFTQKTEFQTLNLALKRIHNNKEQLLLVLARPEIPLHNNLSENDIRDYVKKRKISASTRSDNGRRSRDTFLSLKKTCQKLGISFWDFLQDRLSKQNKIPPLSQIIRNNAAISVV